MEALRTFIGLTLGGFGGFAGRAGEGRFQEWRPECGSGEFSATRNARALCAKQVLAECAVVITARLGEESSCPGHLCRIVLRRLEDVPLWPEAAGQLRSTHSLGMEPPLPLLLEKGPVLSDSAFLCGAAWWSGFSSPQLQGCPGNPWTWWELSE